MAGSEKTLLVRGAVKSFVNEKGESLDYLELRVIVSGIPIRLYVKSGDVTGKEILMNYFKE